MRLKIPKTQEIHRCYEWDSSQLIHLFAYEHWDERSFAIACNLEDLSNRACWVSDVICGWLVVTNPDDANSFEAEYKFFPAQKEEGRPVTYFEL